MPKFGTMGYRQAVRHKTLTLACDSSNLSTPANMVDIVQSVERQIVDLVVAGSSPVIHPIQKTHPIVRFFILNYLLFILHFNGLEPKVSTLSGGPR